MNVSTTKKNNDFFLRVHAKQNNVEKHQQQPDINNTNKNQAIKEISIVLLVLL